MKNLSKVALLALLITMGFEACTKNNNPAPAVVASTNNKVKSSTALFKRDTITPLLKKDTITPIKLVIPLLKRDTITPIKITNPFISKRDTITPTH